MPYSIDRFRGHLIFGTINMALATWWTICALERYFKQLTKNKPYYSTTWFQTKRCARIPVEPMLKILASSSTGCIMWYDFIRSIQLDDGMASTTGAHSVAIVAYLFVPITEVLQFYQISLVGLLDSAPFVVHIFGMLVPSLVFAFHSHGRLIVDTHIHHIMDLNFIFMLLSVILEYKYRNSIVITLSRSYFYLVMGLWANCAAFMLESRVSWIPVWDLEKMDNISLATCLYVFLMTFALLYMLVIGCFVARPYKNFLREAQNKSNGTSSNGISNGISCKTV